MIFGTDDRESVSATDDNASYPWSAVVYIVATFPNGKTVTGSGVLVGDNDVLTAGHVLYSADDGGYATTVTVYPGRDGTEQPYGSYGGTSVSVLDGWIANEDFDADLGLVSLADPIGETTGTMTMGYVSDPATLIGAEVESAGYPGDRNGAMTYTSGTVDRATTTQAYFVDDLDTYYGQSGSPVVTGGIEDDATVIGVVSNQSSMPRYNAAALIDQDAYDSLTGWMATNDQTDSADLLVGHGANDNFAGSAGADFIVGADGADTLAGGSDGDSIYGGTGADHLAGGGDADLMMGGRGNDVLAGDDGDDRLMGDRGNDTLSGGAGADLFVVTPGTGGTDRVLDFDPDGGDRIAIQNAGSVGIDDWTDLEITTSGADTRITIADVSIVLVAVAASDLAADDFLFL